MTAGSFTLVLHSHLPWVLHHGRWPHGVDWLNEAATETYLPLWRLLHARQEGAGPSGVTLGLTPVLCEQLAHPDFHLEWVEYLQQKAAAALEDRAVFERTGETAMAALASRWEKFYRATLEDVLGAHGSNLVARFRRLEEHGTIEIITCAATHGYLPALGRASAVERQIAMARAAHRRHFGRDPRGIWLPECAYRPAGPWPSPATDARLRFESEREMRAGIEESLARHGLEYFFVDTHLIAGGKPLGVYADRFEALRHLVADADATIPRAANDPYHAYRVGQSGVACFGRDPATALQVWSGEHGYPGDGAYLDFHKKRFPGGHRYWRVTHPQADLAHKELYDPSVAAVRAPEHAEHFLGLLAKTLDGRPDDAVVCAMFDTELFGHWWFEGPAFLGQMIERIGTTGVTPTTAGRYLDRHPARTSIALPEGSWGDGGDHRVWLNDATGWTWREVHGAETRFERLERQAEGQSDPLLRRLLAQAGRELLLLEASDWQFLITTQAARDYAERRLSDHAADFDRLAGLAERRMTGGALSETDEHFLAACEQRDSLFPEADWSTLASERLSSGRSSR